MSDNQAYGTKMTYDPMTTNNPAYGPMTTYNQAYGPMTTYSEAYDHVDPEYAVVDDIKDRAPPQPSPIPAMENQYQTSSPLHHPATE